MCELPSRSWRDAVTPSRVATAAAALIAAATGLLVSGPASLGLFAFGAILFVAAVVLPSVQELEFGFPAGFKVVTAVRDREAALRQVFETHRPGFELAANLLCDDSAVAAKLLEAAWGRAASTWRGPVTPELHDYVLCTFAHLLTAHEHWTPRREAADATSTVSQLQRLELTTRIVVVFHEFVEVPLPRLASMVGRTVEQMQVDLLAADEMLTARVATQGSAS
jgi:hypothetical protein